MYSQERLRQDAKIRADFEASIPSRLTSRSQTRFNGIQDPKSLDGKSEHESSVDREYKRRKAQVEQERKNVSPSGQGIRQMDSQRTENLRDLGNRIVGAVPSIYETAANQFLKSNPLTSWMTPGLGTALLVGTSKENGGMVLDGEFSHERNPIDIVQNGVKVGEATGSEYIVNPEQAKKIAAQSAC